MQKNSGQIPLGTAKLPALSDGKTVSKHLPERFFLVIHSWKDFIFPERTRTFNKTPFSNVFQENFYIKDLASSGFEGHTGGQRLASFESSDSNWPGTQTSRAFRCFSYLRKTKHQSFGISVRRIKSIPY